ncbi:sensor histidine kinase [Streptomonospora wellingtoniae]|uniref:histidine kinase n=1 Tax=Streptomonospora wellingtoniae TaxID=3075544 RepID=A0ABU2KUH7_9ACTN|nr:sensor histidine kinase [Streptomonospora sp. DSM 45055]MDT0302723.1 sensor histidine kinase [Streptomonospora sp. DSM 45055]
MTAAPPGPAPDTSSGADDARGGGPAPLPARRWAWLTDAAMVVALAATNSALVTLSRDIPEMAAVWSHGAAGHAAGAALALTVLARRYLPFTVLIVLTVSGLAGDVAGVLVWGAASPGIAAAAYSVGRYLTLVRSLAGVGAGVMVNLATTALSPATGAADSGEPWWINQAFYLGWILASWWVGRLVRMRSFHMVELATRAERLERARDAHTRAVLAEERTRIARELHDVVAHHVSVMTVQATAGRRVIERSPDRARQTLVEIEETGRQAMSEMRRIVDVLREPDGGAERGPQPGLAGIGDLVRQISDTGTPVELVAEGVPVELAPGLDLTLYRVVQESLTNVLKHAGRDAPTTVSVRYGARAVDVSVVDEGGSAPGTGSRPQASDEPGHGLVGMRERVVLYGGELEARPRGGGFEVRARIPLAHRG